MAGAILKIGNGRLALVDGLSFGCRSLRIKLLRQLSPTEWVSVMALF
jgi:hypothetical protein